MIKLKDARNEQRNQDH